MESAEIHQKRCPNIPLPCRTKQSESVNITASFFFFFGQTARELEHVLVRPPRGQTCGNAVFNDPDHLVLSFSRVSNELCICGDLWRAMLSPALPPRTQTLHRFFTGSQLGKAKLLNLRK